MKQLNGFEKYVGKPNTIHKKGSLYTKEVILKSLKYDAKRTIRVYLPSTYDFDNSEKRFPVLYMMDGKNLVDKYTSFAGEWGIDEVIEERIKNKKKECIVVGIDSPIDGEERMIEMAFEGKFSSKEYNKENVEVDGPKLGEEIINTIKSLIDNTFFTIKSKENTGIGGSSMGGLFSFYMGMKYKNIFGYILSFSPGFLIYNFDFYKDKLKKGIRKLEDSPKIYFFVGGKDFEEGFIESTFFTFNYLKSVSSEQEKMRLVFDSSQIHHERSWNKYLPDALSFWLD